MRRRSGSLISNSETVARLREPAVLAVLARTHADKLAQLDIHSATQWWDVAEKRAPRPLTHLAGSSLEPMKSIRFVLPNPADLQCSVLPSIRSEFGLRHRLTCAARLRRTQHLAHDAADATIAQGYFYLSYQS